MIILNVGGVYFYTSSETLTIRDTFFKPLVQNSNIEEPIFIDRDPFQFRYILNWLRGVHSLPDDVKNLEELRAEADFYNIEDLVAEIDKVMKRSSTVLDEIKAIRKALNR